MKDLFFRKPTTAQWRNDEMEGERPGKGGETKAGAVECTEKISHVLPLIKNLPKSIPSPDFLWDHLDHMKWQVEQDREAENSDHPIHHVQVDLKGVPWWCQLQCVSSKWQRGTSRNSQTIVGRKASEWRAYSTDNISPNGRGILQCINSNLQSEIQHLKVNPQIWPEL